jgi:cytochrome P450
MKIKGKLNYDLLQNLVYLDAVLSETLRKYPPLLVLARTSQKEYILGEKGLVLDPETEIQIPVYAIHHNPEYYPDPETFDPKRFLPQNRDQIKPFTYLPFGAGPRNCIGLQFALLEAKLVITRVLTRFRFYKIDKTPETPEYLKGSIFLPNKGLPLGVEKLGM